MEAGGEGEGERSQTGSLGLPVRVGVTRWLHIQMRRTARATMHLGLPCCLYANRHGSCMQMGMETNSVSL